MFRDHEQNHAPKVSCPKCGLYLAQLPRGFDLDEEECEQRTKTVHQLEAIKGSVNPACAVVAGKLIKATRDWVTENCENGQKKQNTQALNIRVLL